MLKDKCVRSAQFLFEQNKTNYEDLTEPYQLVQGFKKPK